MNCDLSLEGREELGVVWVFRKEEATNGSDADGRRTFADAVSVCLRKGVARTRDLHDKEPFPSRDPVSPVELQETSSDEAAEGVAKLLKQVQAWTSAMSGPIQGVLCLPAILTPSSCLLYHADSR
jgi:hypothetical protein